MNDVLGEFLGTMILILLGNGVVAGVLLNKTKSQHAGWMVITAGWAFAVMAGVYTAKAMGAPGYINPVGPLADVLREKLAAVKAITFAAAEVAGAIVGAILVWLHHWPHWKETPDPATKLACFCTSPAIRNPRANVFSEALATFVLVFVGTAVDRSNPGGLGVPLAGAIVWSIGLSLGATTGYAINPARDFGPRLAHAILPVAGKGETDWEYSWVPIIGPLIGGAAGALFAKAVMG